MTICEAEKVSSPEVIRKAISVFLEKKQAVLEVFGLWKTKAGWIDLSKADRLLW
jgi:hypothetical protein